MSARDAGLEPHLEVVLLVDEFVAQLTRVARRIAVDILSRSLDEPSETPMENSGGEGHGRHQLHQPAKQGPRVVRGRTHRTKRSVAELEELASRFMSTIVKSPGLRIEEINRRMGTRPRELQLAIAKLAAQGRLRVEGNKRATRYYPVVGTGARKSKR